MTVTTVYCAQSPNSGAGGIGILPQAVGHGRKEVGLFPLALLFQSLQLFRALDRTERA